MQKLTKENFGLYVILTEPVTGYAACAEAAVRAGVQYIQLRMKNVDTEEYLKTAQQIRAVTKQSGCLFIVNDNLEVAMAVDADGIHLGQNDMPLEEARRVWNTPGKIFGLSTHNEQQAQKAVALEPDYIGVGPVFPTPAKAVPDPVLGVERMGAIIKSTPLPAVAIGGINWENLQSVLAAGARNFSAVRPVTQSSDPYRAIMELQQIRDTTQTSQASR